MVVAVYSGPYTPSGHILKHFYSIVLHLIKLAAEKNDNDPAAIE